MVNDNTQFITNKKPSVDIKTMEMCSCIKSVLLAEDIYNGRLYHTTDTNEFFFDWNDKRYLLNWINTSEINEVNLSDVVRFGERISKLNNDANYINITTLKEWLDANNYRPYEEPVLNINNTSDDSDVIESIQNWLSHIRGEIELFKRNDVGDYLDENGSVISDPRKNLDKLVERESLLKTDIELLIERNKIYWGGDLDF
jgi:hypothetical protein